MKLISAKLILLLAAVCVCGAASQTSFAQAAPTDKGWPRKLTTGAGSFLVYQPQIEQWQGNRFEARAAVAISGEQSKQTTYGVLWFTARTEIDKINRLVRMTDFQITKVNFPTAAEKAELYRDLLQRQVPKAGDVIALDRLLAEMAIAEAGGENTRYQLKNNAPRIFFSTRPSILILIDGSPVLRPVKETELKRVINTRALILQDGSNGKFYLHLMDGWMESIAVTGPWVVAHNTPDDLGKALKIAADSKQVDLLDGSGEGSGQSRPSLKSAVNTGLIPTIYTSTEPAELIQTMGDPQVATIEGTQLIYVANTENDIFVEVPTQTHYVLISGRWFRSQTMNGPWSYVAGNELPADFARIPATHPKADVLVSVPGTPQAKEALIANNIPQTATVTRSAASLTISYDGPPQFKSIESTSLLYAVNTATPVIAVSAASYYAVQNGVWFAAGSPAGPWAVATSVPAVIYTIPPSSPLHRVTYVKVYGATTEVVYVGYTPGYYGTVVSSDNVVVYGTGWYFPPYIGSYWYGWGWTYGYGAAFAWNTYAGWGVAFGVGYGWSSYYNPGAWYGAAAWANPYTGNVGYGRAYSGVNAATGTRYNGRGFTNTNVYTGTTVSGVGGVAYNPNTGRIAAGQAGAVSNAYTGNAAAGARGVHYNPQTGVISGGAVGATYNADTGKVTAGGRGFAYNTKTDTGVVVGKNNVYAGKDGEIYRYNRSSGFEQHTSSGWSSVSRPTDKQSFQNQQSARATGQQRWDNFRSTGGRSFGGGSLRGSGSRFGGRRR